MQASQFSLKRFTPDENTLLIEKSLQKRAHIEQECMSDVEEESSSEEIVVIPATRKRERQDDRDCDILIRKLTQVSFDEKLVLNEVSETGGPTISKKSVSLELHSDISLEMSDAEFETICRERYYATRITVPQAKNITDFGFANAFFGRTNMYEINLALCSSITDWTMFHIGNSCPMLYSFSIMQCPITDHGVNLLTTHCKKLRALKLDWCNLTDLSLEAIAKNCPLLKEFTAAEGTQFSLNGFYTLIRGCPNLQCLELWDCTQVTDEWMYALIASDCQIKELDISGCHLITNDALVALEKHFKGIKITPPAPLTEGAAPA